jgi:molybdate transport system ATP-binding protein
VSLYCKIRKKLNNFVLDITFEAGDETVALMGASGCGKSMTLRCIAGIEEPDTGLIIINGTTVFDSNKKICLPPQKRKTGYLFQDYALFPNMTVRGNISSVLPKNRIGEMKNIINTFHLDGLEGHYPAQLSGGQKQRCALARMMISEPEVILLDEPFSALDSYLRWKMEQEIVTAIEKFGKTVLFVSHDRDEVYRISDRVVVIEHGKNEAIAKKQDLYQHPLTYADALLTGCKNICPVIVDGGLVRAPEFGIQFAYDAASENTAFMGIRAKLIQPAFLVKEKNNKIFLTYEIISVTESVFSMILMVKPSQAEGILRWEMTKNTFVQLQSHPNTLAIAKEDILLLKEK